MVIKETGAADISDDDFFLTVDEVAARARISRSMVYKLTSKNSLPHIKIGRKTLISYQDYKRWTEQLRGEGFSS